jgi:hypothetical protein
VCVSADCIYVYYHVLAALILFAFVNTLYVSSGNDKLRNINWIQIILPRVRTLFYAENDRVEYVLRVHSMRSALGSHFWIFGHVVTCHMSL